MASEIDKPVPEQPSSIESGSESSEQIDRDGEIDPAKAERRQIRRRMLGITAYRGYNIVTGGLLAVGGIQLLEPGQSMPTALAVASGVTAALVGVRRFMNNSNPYEFHNELYAHLHGASEVARSEDTVDQSDHYVADSSSPVGAADDSEESDR